MFDFFSALSFGREVECHGEKWLIMMPLQNRCSLAVKTEDALPCQVFLIQEPEKPKSESVEKP